MNNRFFGSLWMWLYLLSPFSCSCKASGQKLRILHHTSHLSRQRASKKYFSWSLSKEIYVPPWQRKDCQADEHWWTFTTKSPSITILWFSFLRKDIPKECFLSIPSLTKHNINIKWNVVYFHRSFINENLHVSRSFAIFLWKRMAFLL